MLAALVRHRAAAVVAAAAPALGAFATRALATRMGSSVLERGLSPVRDFLPADYGRRVYAEREQVELRTHDFETLHKLWFVLLKEKNQLLTMQHVARQSQRRFKGMPQLSKVKKSMARLLTVLHERKTAFQEARRTLENQGVPLPETRVQVTDSDSTWTTRAALPRPKRRPNTRFYKAQKFKRALEADAAAMAGQSAPSTTPS